MANWWDGLYSFNGPIQGQNQTTADFNQQNQGYMQGLTNQANSIQDPQQRAVYVHNTPYLSQNFQNFVDPQAWQNTFAGNGDPSQDASARGMAGGVQGNLSNPGNMYGSQGSTLGGLAGSTPTPPVSGGGSPYEAPTFGVPSTGGGDPMQGAGGLGGMMTTGGTPNFNEATGNYTGGNSLSDYTNPAFQFNMDNGLKAVQSSYAGAGNFLSGPAMKGINDYAQGQAANQYQNSFNNYMQDKGFNYGVDNTDRNFQFNQGQQNFNNQMTALGFNAGQSNQNFQNNLAANQFNLGASNAGFNNNLAANQFNLGAGNQNFQNNLAANAQNYGMNANDQQQAFNRLNTLAGLGQNANNTSASMNSIMAALLSQNLLSGAGAGATGLIGQGNTVNSAISQMLNQYMTGSLLNRIPGLNNGSGGSTLLPGGGG